MKVLVVEDDPNYAEIVLKALQGFAKEIKLVRQWIDAELLIKSKPDIAWIDLRLLDINLADELHRIKAIREDNPNLVIIIVSGYIDEDLYRKLKAIGVDYTSAKSDRIDPYQIASLTMLGLLTAVKRGVINLEPFINHGLKLLKQRYPELPTPTL